MCEADCETVYTEEVEEKQSLSMTILVGRQADRDMKKSLSIGGCLADVKARCDDLPRSF